MAKLSKLLIFGVIVTLMINIVLFVGAITTGGEYESKSGQTMEEIVSGEAIGSYGISSKSWTLLLGGINSSQSGQYQYNELTAEYLAPSGQSGIQSMMDILVNMPKYLQLFIELLGVPFSPSATISAYMHERITPTESPWAFYLLSAISLQLTVMNLIVLLRIIMGSYKIGE